MTFTDLASHYLSRAKIDKAQLAKRVGVSTTYIYDIFSQKKPPGSFEVTSKIGDALELTKSERIEFLTAAWKAKFNDDDKQFFNAYSELLRTAGLEAYGPLFNDPTVANVIVRPKMGALLTELMQLPENF